MNVADLVVGAVALSCSYLGICSGSSALSASSEAGPVKIRRLGGCDDRLATVRRRTSGRCSRRRRRVLCPWSQDSFNRAVRDHHINDGKGSTDSSRPRFVTDDRPHAESLTRRDPQKAVQLERRPGNSSHTRALLRGLPGRYPQGCDLRVSCRSTSCSTPSSQSLGYPSNRVGLSSERSIEMRHFTSAEALSRQVRPPHQKEYDRFSAPESLAPGAQVLGFSSRSTHPRVALLRHGGRALVASGTQRVTSSATVRASSAGADSRDGTGAIIGGGC